MRPFRLKLRGMMAAVAVAAVAVWVGMNWLEWREALHQWRVNRPIQRLLDQQVTLRYPKGVAIDQFAADIKRQTASPRSPQGFVLHLDPQGLVDVDAMRLKVDVESVPLRDALDAALKPLGLKLYVQDGIATVVDPREMEN